MAADARRDSVREDASPWPPQPADEAPHAGISGGDPDIIDEVLPIGDRRARARVGESEGQSPSDQKSAPGRTRTCDPRLRRPWKGGNREQHGAAAPVFPRDFAHSRQLRPTPSRY